MNNADSENAVKGEPVCPHNILYVDLFLNNIGFMN